MHYLRTKDGKELDFIVVIDDKPVLCLEVKSNDQGLSKNFGHFQKYLGDISYVQLVPGLSREYDSADGIKMRNLERFLAELSGMLT